jgi:prepilin peptidase CpaA
MIMQATVDIILILVIGYCAYTDVRYRQIYNYITLPTIILGLALNFMLDGTSGLTTSLMGMGTGLALFLVFYLLNSMGGGDIKLLAAIGALKGFPFVICVAVLAVLLGGVYALVIIVRKKMLGEVMGRMLTAFQPQGEMVAGNDPQRITVPLGLFIGIGSFCAMGILYF